MEYYNDGRTIITSKQLIHGSKTIPLELISDQRYFKMPFEIGGFAINVAGVFVALWMFSTIKLWFILVGLPIIAICGFNVRNMLTTETHILSIDLHGGSEYKLTGGKGGSIEQISEALKLARVGS